jgi:hypothetical protein
MPNAVEYLKELMAIATGQPVGDSKVVTKKRPALLNFMKTHHLKGTIRGVPNWQRLEEYYTRGRKTYPNKGNIPGSTHREMERRS